MNVLLMLHGSTVNVCILFHRSIASAIPTSNLVSAVKVLKIFRFWGQKGETSLRSGCQYCCHVLLRGEQYPETYRNLITGYVFHTTQHLALQKVILSKRVQRSIVNTLFC